MTRCLFQGLAAMAIFAASSTAANAQWFPRSDLQRLPRMESPSFFLECPEFVVRFQDSVVPVSLGADSEVVGDNGSDSGCDGECGGTCKRHCGHGGCYAGVCCKRPGEITFKPGFRIQSRYVYFDNNDDNDFFIRRFRMKGSGDIFDIAKYGTELKVDSSEKFGLSSTNGSLPTPVVENAWVDFKLPHERAYLRVGLYDIPFSRNSLTSDSKLLLMDRTLIKEQLTKIGFTDNTVGVMLHGRPADGRLEYSVGVFDNIFFDAPVRQSDELTPCGRIAWYLLDPADAADGYADYKESYLGQGRRLVIAANAVSTANVIDTAFASPYDVYAWGVDLFFNAGRFVFQAEYDWFSRDLAGGLADDIGEGWYVQAGYICNRCWELVARFQSHNDPINPVDSSEHVEWTQVGVNYYFHEHNLKIQSDYTWKNETGTEIANDGFQLQLQLDF